MNGTGSRSKSVLVTRFSILTLHNDWSVINNTPGIFLVVIDPAGIESIWLHIAKFTFRVLRVCEQKLLVDLRT